MTIVFELDVPWIFTRSVAGNHGCWSSRVQGLGLNSLSFKPECFKSVLSRLLPHTNLEGQGTKKLLVAGPRARGATYVCLVTGIAGGAISPVINRQQVA